MRLVIDTSALRSALTRDYLGASVNNEVIVPQPVLVECLKGNAAENMRRSLIGLTEFSSQISILKAGKTLLKMRPRVTGLQSRLIDYRLTRGFRRNVSFNLRQTGIAGLEVDQMIQSDKGTADVIHANYLQLSPRSRAGMLRDLSMLSDEEIRALRSRKEVLPNLLRKVECRALATTAADFNKLGRDLASIPVRDAVYALQFRYAVAAESLMIEWCANSGLETRSDKSIANDLIDLSQVAYGTYFDGVLASDKRLLRVAELARILARALIKLHQAEPSDEPNGASPRRLS